MKSFIVLSMLILGLSVGIALAGDCCTGAEFTYSHTFPTSGTPAFSSIPKFNIDVSPYPNQGAECCQDVGWQFDFTALQVFTEGTVFEFRAAYSLQCDSGIPATGYIYAGGIGSTFIYSQFGGDGPGNWGAGMTMPFGFDCGCELTFTFEVRMNGGSWQTFTSGGTALSMTIVCPDF